MPTPFKAQNGLRPLLLPFLASLCALACALALTPAPALAVVTHPLEASFGPDGTEASVFGQAAAVGVDQGTGESYVEDAAAGAVYKFDSQHHPVAFTGVNVNIEGSKLKGFEFRPTESELAVSPASHDWYGVNNGTNTIRAFQSDGTPAEFTEGPGKGTNEISGIGEVCGVAVDSAGDIYAGVFTHGVYVFSPAGELLASFEAEHACKLAVDSGGRVYVNAFNGPVTRFTPSEFPVSASTEYTAAAAPVDPNESHGVAVSPATNDVYVDEHTEVVEYNQAGEHVLTFPVGGEPGALEFPQGIAVSVFGGAEKIYVPDLEGKHQVEVFKSVVLPGVETQPASEVSETALTLHGSVSSEGVPVSECFFEYGTSASYGQKVQCAQTPAEINAAGEPAPVSAKLSGLPPAKAWHFRLVVLNTVGGEGRGVHVTVNRPAVAS